MEKILTKWCFWRVNLSFDKILSMKMIKTANLFPDFTTIKIDYS